MIFHRKQRELNRLRLETQLQSELASAAMAQAAEQRRQYEARIADIKEANELRAKETLRTIKALAEEVEFLRAKHFGPRQAPESRAVQVLPEEFDFMPSSNPHYLSEEAEELEALRVGGHLDNAEYTAALDQIKSYVRGPVQIEQ